MVAGTAIVPLVAYLLRDFPLTMSDVFNLVAPIQYIAIVWLFAYLPTSEKQRHQLVQFMLLCASIVALVGLMQAANFGPALNVINAFYPSKHLEDAAQYGRVTSTLGAWNSLGNFLMVALIMVVALNGYKERTRLAKLNMLVCLALSGACLLASGSYASLIGLGMSIVIMSVFDRRNIKIIVLLLIGMAVGGFFLQSLINERLQYQFDDGGELLPATLVYRFKVWEQIYLPIIEKNPLWGVMPTFAGRVSWAWAESQYLYLLFRSGVVSLLAHLGYVAILIRWSYRHARHGVGLDRPLAMALLAILISLTIMGVTNEVFTSSGVIDYLWMLVGLNAYRRAKLAEPPPLAKPARDVLLLSLPQSAKGRA
jgi:hypothetical protein